MGGNSCKLQRQERLAKCFDSVYSWLHSGEESLFAHEVVPATCATCPCVDSERAFFPAWGCELMDGGEKHSEKCLAVRWLLKTHKHFHGKANLILAQSHARVAIVET